MYPVLGFFPCTRKGLCRAEIGPVSVSYCHPTSDQFSQSNIDKVNRSLLSHVCVSSLHWVCLKSKIAAVSLPAIKCSRKPSYCGQSGLILESAIDNISIYNLPALAKHRKIMTSRRSGSRKRIGHRYWCYLMATTRYREPK